VVKIVVSLKNSTPKRGSKSLESHDDFKKTIPHCISPLKRAENSVSNNRLRKSLTGMAARLFSPLPGVIYTKKKGWLSKKSICDTNPYTLF